MALNSQPSASGEKGDVTAGQPIRGRDAQAGGAECVLVQLVCICLCVRVRECACVRECEQVAVIFLIS